ncbi:DNA polymerase III subunit gamma and tau [Glutamicibacter creatinolyticus]|uniref:DNA polymerase III subunit gamma and tau n=1 Tax=Glutamicibacter creatinolyticus TaxID=162496 RepID=UPI001FE5B2D7|nr:DNA polymerase III subunit gamma and tau [Glutamicibacter creatinolyticus]
MGVSTALYRRYRPDTFADVIGQEHVTTPLMTALSKNRVNHAYLFSGPRGCGKTTSARILARCLNCAEGPTPTPCGKCDSCIELASGGPGSLDVIEIDAASHGGVEDARDLRERATFAPTRDRYKVFIIDEAHMVTPAGFNALLKIVEEPPAHIKFIFATTEPDKVIGTIRSRTHHYPFRLVPPEALLQYLQTLCERENVQVAEGVLPLVIRAGGGSVRDTLSVLDQLMAGASEAGVDYETAVALLGYTHATLLDEVSLALHEADGASLFDAIDRIVQTGLDPRRFVEDLLERFRDLIIAKAVPEGLEKILRGMPGDQLQSLADQSTLFGQAELSRWADVTNQALTDMTGATSPRLHLELLAARLLLPSADAGASAVAARLDRLERHAMTGGALPELAQDGSSDAPMSSAPMASPESTRQGAAAVREALAAARARKQGTAPAETASPQSQEPETPAAQQPEQVPADAQTAHSQTPASDHRQPQEPSAQQIPDAEDGPLDPGGSLNTGADADWGGTWGPISDAPSNPVTTPVDPSPSVPAQRPEGVSPFSLVPDPASGEDLSFGTGVPIDDVKQNAAMAEFAKRAAAQREQSQPQGPAAPQQTGQQQPASPQPAQDSPAHPAQFEQHRGADEQDQHAEQQRAEAQRQAEENARREQAQREQAQREQAEREQAQRAEAQRQAEENARREQAEREQAQRAEAQRQAEEIARREQAQREQAQREQAQRAEQQRQMQQEQQRPQQQAPHGLPSPQRQQPQQQSQAAAASGGSGGAVEAFQQAWPTILEQLQSHSRVLHSMVANYANIGGFDGRTLTLAFSNSGPLVNLRNRPDMMGLLTNTVSQVMRQQVEVVLTEGGSGPTGGGSPKGDRRPQPASAPVAERQSNAAADAPAPTPHSPQAASVAQPSRQEPAGQRAGADSAPAGISAPPYDEPPYDEEPPYDPYEDSYPPEDSYYSPEPSRPQPAARPAAADVPATPARQDPSGPVAPSGQTAAPGAPRTFDGPPVAPKPRMTAGMSARQAEQGGPAAPAAAAGGYSRPVSDVPLRPGSTTDSFPTPTGPVDVPSEPAPPAPGNEPQRRQPEPPQAHREAPIPARPEPTGLPQAQPSQPSQPHQQRPPMNQEPAPVAPAHGAGHASAADNAWGQPAAPRAQSGAPAAPAPAAPAAPAAQGGQRLSRYQQLMNQARSSSSPVDSAAGSWGQPQRSAPQRPTPQPEPEPDEFVPSDDDIAVEDSNLIGVPAIERLLGGVVIEQRDTNGNPVELRRSL